MFSMVADQWPTIREDIEQIGTEFPDLDSLRKIKERTGTDSTSSDDGVVDDAEAIDSETEAAEVQAAKVMLNAGILQLRSGDHKEAITTCDSIIEHYSKMPQTRLQVALAMGIKGIAQLQNHDHEAALSSF